MKERPPSETAISLLSDRALDQAIWAFVWLGVILRLVRYLLKFPLSRDEAMLASSLIDRKYLELLEPLDYGQVAPFAYLWVNKAVITLLNFSELSLRLLPFAFGVGSLFLIRWLAVRVIPGIPALLAVGILSVAYYPIRLATEAKPYSLDLFVALVLTLLAVQVWKEPERHIWILLLAMIAPFAVLISYPATFVIGGVGLALLPAVRRADGPTKFGWLAFAGLSFGTFLAVYWWTTRAQYESSLVAADVLTFWARGFPPLDSPFGFLRWFLYAHLGRTFAYPVGAENGGSILTFGCFVVGAVVLYRNGKRWLLAILLMPFALTAVAAAFKLYPYGGSGRITQHFVPAISLLAGLGLASLLLRRKDVAGRRKGLAWAIGFLLVVGFGSTVRYAVSRYQDEESSVTAREFAKSFWTQNALDAELVCAIVDVPAISAYRGQLPHMHRYWTNQRIYFDRLHHRESPNFDSITDDHPLRVAVPDARINSSDTSQLPADVRTSLDEWLDGLRTLYTHVSSEKFLAESYDDRGVVREVWVDLLEFVPRETPTPLPDGADLRRMP